MNFSTIFELKITDKIYEITMQLDALFRAIRTF